CVACVACAVALAACAGRGATASAAMPPIPIPSTRRRVTSPPVILGRLNECFGRLALQLAVFFQAGDGIRDLTVTGVQTCALPILCGVVARRRGGGEAVAAEVLLDAKAAIAVGVGDRDALRHGDAVVRGKDGVRVGENAVVVRSEERRVGKEWRCGWGLES